MPTPVPPEVLAAARAAAENSLVRYAAGDTSVTDEEALVYRNLIHALKLSGVRSLVMELIDRAGSPGNFRTV
jgi:hypothetical protein